MALQITPNARTAGNLNITANQRARMSSVLSIDWNNVTGVPPGVTAIGSVTGTGFLSIVNSDGGGALRTITGTASEITLTNGNGVAGNPVASLPSALTFTGKTITGGTYTGAVSFNGNFWTVGTGTLTLGAGKTATISNTLTFTGTDASSVAFGTGGTVTYTANNLSVFAATTSAQLAGVISDETGTGALVFANSPTLVTPALGTPSAIVLTSATGLPVSTGISGLAAGVAAFLAAPSSANLATAMTDETGSGANVFANTPTLVTPILGVAAATSINKVALTAPATSATLTIPDGVTLTGPAASGTAMTLGNVETITGAKTFNDAKLILAGVTSGTTTLKATGTASGVVTLPAATDTLVGKATTDTLTNKTFDTAGVGNSFSINSVAATANSGTGAVARATSPTFVTPALGTPSSGTLTSCTGLPLSGLTTQAAFTFVGNNTGGSAVPTAVDIAALTAKASPASTDLVLLSDQAASGAWKKVTVSSLASAGSVASIAGNTGAFTLGNGLTNSVNVLKVNAGHVPGCDGTFSASAGEVGEYISVSLAFASRVTLSTGVNSNIAALTNLTPGDWDVSGVVYYETTGAPVAQYTLVTTDFVGSDSVYGGDYTAAVTDVAAILPAQRVLITTNTTINLIANTGWTGGATPTVKSWGRIWARRIR